MSLPPPIAANTLRIMVEEYETHPPGFYGSAPKIIRVRERLQYWNGLNWIDVPKYHKPLAGRAGEPKEDGSA